MCLCSAGGCGGGGVEVSPCVCVEVSPLCVYVEVSPCVCVQQEDAEVEVLKCHCVFVLKCHRVFVLKCHRVFVLKCHRVFVLKCHRVFVFSRRMRRWRC